MGRIARAWLAGLLLAGAAGTVEADPVGTDLARLARTFAPVLRQDTAGEADFITRIDFDGNWAGDDNWSNMEKFPLAAAVYWAGVETGTHVFLSYSWFHPRDWCRRIEAVGSLIGKLIGYPDCAHENDLEGMLLVLEKGRGRAHVVAVETVFHRQFKKYLVDRRYLARAELSGELRFEDTHPVVMLEAHGHGAEAWDGKDFRGGDGVVYRVGDRQGVPRNRNDRDVPYALVDLESTLWPRRFDVGEKGNTFGKADLFHGVRMGYAFLGRHGGDNAANAPWGWSDEATDLPRGEIFLDPARLFRTHFEPPGGFDRNYLPNPFTDPARRGPAVARGGTTGGGRGRPPGDLLGQELVPTRTAD